MYQVIKRDGKVSGFDIIKIADAIKKAFEAQLKGLGSGFVAILATCPTNWKMSPKEAHQRVRDEMIPVFPLGVFKDVTAEEGGNK